MLVACLFFYTSILAAEENLLKADSLFELRNNGFCEEYPFANADAIRQAAFYYQKALLEAESDSLKHEAVWKNLQALYFLGKYATQDKGKKKEIFSQAIKFGEKYENEFPESAEIANWMGVLWSRWAENHGIFSAARKGVAGKIKNYAEKAIRLDENYLDAGGYRLLGMVYFKAPKIPLFLTWPSKEKALQYLEKAFSIAPGSLFNKLYLAEVLHESGQHDRAKKLLTEIIGEEKIVHDIAVDYYIKQEAKNYLVKHY